MAVICLRLVINDLIFLEISEQKETQGLDIGEHGMEAYPQFCLC